MMSPTRTIDKYIEEIKKYRKSDSLLDAVIELEKGKPVAVETDSGLKLLLPESAVGFPITRILEDLPLKTVPLIKTDETIEEVESAMLSMNSDYSFVFKNDRLLGIVSLERILIAAMETAKRGVSLAMALGEVLESERAVILRIEIAEKDKGREFLNRPIEIYGPIDELLGIEKREPNIKIDLLSDLLSDTDKIKLLNLIDNVILSGNKNEITVLIESPRKKNIYLNVYAVFRKRKGAKRGSLLLYITDVTEMWQLIEIQKLLTNANPISGLREAIRYIVNVFSLVAGALLFVKAKESSLKVTPHVLWVKPDTMDNFSAFFLSGKNAKSHGKLYEDLNRAIENKEKIVGLNVGVSIFKRYGIKSYLLVPCITDGEEKVVIALLSNNENGIGKNLINMWERLLSSFQGTVKAYMLKNKLRESKVNLEKKVKERTYQLNVLYHVTKSLGYSINYEEALKAMLNYIGHLFNYDLAATFFLSNGNITIAFYERGNTNKDLLDNAVEEMVEMYERLSGKKVGRKQITVRKSNIVQNRAISIEKVRSTYLIPVKGGTRDEVKGLFFIGFKDEKVLSDEEVKLLETVSNEAALAIDKWNILMKTEQKRLERIIEQIPDGIVILDDKYRIVFCNSNGRDYIDIISGKVLDGKIDKLGDANIEDLCRTDIKEPVWHRITVEKPEKRVFMVALVQADETEKNDRWILIIHDVTVENDIIEKSKRQDLLASVGQLAAGIAHDFNNILTGIIGFTQYLQTKKDIPDYARTFLGKMEKQSYRAVDLIRSILDFSRQSVVMKSRLDTIPLLKEIVKLLERTIPANIEIRLIIKAKSSIIYSNPTQIQQIITNLAVNAKDAMTEGGVLTISLENVVFDRDNPPPFANMENMKWLLLKVSDTGTGMPEEIISNIFEPFFTTKETGKGTGLGLSQVYGIVKQNEGEIEVESKLGEGTTFKIYFPLKEDEEEKETEESNALLNVVSNRQVLLVEDEETVREAIRLMLEQLGFQVSVSENAESALAVLKEKGQYIDMVVTDMVMPGMYGTELAVKIKEMFPDIKIVGMSGYPLGSAETDVSRASLNRHSLDGWITKPVNMGKLSDTISKCFNS